MTKTRVQNGYFTKGEFNQFLLQIYHWHFKILKHLSNTFYISCFCKINTRQKGRNNLGTNGIPSVLQKIEYHLKSWLNYPVIIQT